MSRLSDKFIYEINNKTLTIKKCPNNILNNKLIAKIFSNNHITNLIIEEGVEVIAEATFSWHAELEKVKLPSSLNKIEKDAFNECLTLRKIIFPNSFNNLEIGESAFALSDIEDLNIPEGVVSIGKNAFNQCQLLKSVKLPKSLKILESHAFFECEKLVSVNISSNLEIIEDSTFAYCKNLKRITLPDGLKEIGKWAFKECNSLRHISLPESLISIAEEAFESCSNLRSIEIPEGIEELNGCFSFCQKLKKVTLPESLKVITNEAFSNCSSLRKINLPKSLEIIGVGSFFKSGLWKIDIPSTVRRIEEGAFRYCENLFNVNFNEGLKKIEENAFYGCYYLTRASLPDSVEVVEEGAFKSCSNLTSIDLPKSLKILNNEVFETCFKLRSVEIPEGVERASLGAFNRCHKLEEIHLPSTLKCVTGERFITRPLKLQRIYLQCKDGKKEIDLSTKKFCSNTSNKLFLFDTKSEKYSFYDEGEYIEFSELSLKENPKIRRMINEGYLHEQDYINLYYWHNKKIIPSPSVIKTMPIKDIDNFFVNKNCIEWAKLVKESNVEKTYEAVSSFFKLCYVLGVFSESTASRDKAVEFIRENIISRLDGGMIHSKFDGFVLDNGFNKEYAEFFMKYYNSKDFMLTGDVDDGVVDLTCASYNNFNQVKKVYPNKTLNTNRKADLLLPEHVINAVRVVEYDDVDDDNEEFAFEVGKYGYTQKQFEVLQEWYNKAKKIKTNDMKLFISKDKEKTGITYELLRKDDPRTAVLGNITNCCQILDGAGEDCVEYGMIKPNSGFITFNYKDKIIAQAWVWYDEISKVVCLDNIEVPHRYFKRINENKEIKESFIDCLLRVEENLKIEMNKHSLEVKKVTIGKGYNDIIGILNDKFNVEENSIALHGYNGYSDAYNQYKIENKNVNKRR